MKEIKSLIERADRYLRSAEVLLKEGDYEYTFVISKNEAEEMLDNGKKFVKKIIQHLNEKKIL